MDPLLVDSVVRAMHIREKSPLFRDFDEETLGFLQDLFLWRRPDKFVIDGENVTFTGGRVSLWSGQSRNRVLQFDLSNGDIWEASITKLGSRALIQTCREIFEFELKAEEALYLDDEEEAA